MGMKRRVFWEWREENCGYYDCVMIGNIHMRKDRHKNSSSLFSLCDTGKEGYLPLRSHGDCTRDTGHCITFPTVTCFPMKLCQGLKTICNSYFHHSYIKDFGCVHDCNCSHINCIYPQFPAITRNMTKLWPRFLHCSGILTDLERADFEHHSCFVWRGKHFNNSPNLNIQTKEGNLLMNFHTLPWYHFLPFLFCIFPLPTPKYPHEFWHGKILQPHHYC